MPTPSTARMHDFEVVSNQEIADGIFSLVISAPKLASALKPGQFDEHRRARAMRPRCFACL